MLNRLKECVDVESARQVLRDMLDSGWNPDADEFPLCREQYARYRIDNGRGPNVVLMVWAPGQGTPVHDHDGANGVEAVMQGHLEIVPFVRNGSALMPMAAETAVAGDIETITPPIDIHLVRNVGPEVCVTIHVYSHEVKVCNRYVEDGGQWRAEPVALSYTSKERQLAAPAGFVPRLQHAYAGQKA